MWISVIAVGIIIGIFISKEREFKLVPKKIPVKHSDPNRNSRK